VRLRLGTRGSRLALVQSRLVAERLAGMGVAVELITVVTEGDRRSGQQPGEGLFVTALERALLEGRIDLAVHSAKDLPLKEHDGLAIAAYPERADPRDALVSPGGGLDSLPPGARLGTDSPRRVGFLLHRRPDLRWWRLRGNVDTRLRKLDQGEVDAVVLAAAGLDRLGLGGRVSERLAPDVLPPAAAQGALAVQCRAGSQEYALLARLDDPDIRLAVSVERRVLEETGGTCRSAVGALARVRGSRLELVAGAAVPDGSDRCLLRMEGEATQAGGLRLAAAAARELMDKVVSGVA
jgi:hydroxymethylbilane synthase